LRLGLCSPGRLGALLGGLDDRIGNLGRRSLAETRGREELLRALLGSGDDRRRLRTCPFECLFDLGAGRVRELGRLVTRLLEQARAARLCLAKFLCRFLVRFGEELASLVPGRGQNLVALALTLVAVALDIGFLLLEVDLLLPHFLLGPLNLSGGCLLSVTLEHVCELGGLADQVERIHADAMPGGIDLRGPACGLEHAKLGLELDGMATERLECGADGLLVETALRDREVVDARQRRHRRRLARCSWSLYRHSFPPRLCRPKYARSIGRSGRLP